MFILLIHVAAVLFMTGFIWTIQLVHYPLFNRVGDDAFPRYEADQRRLVVLLVGPGFLITLITCVLLLFSRPQEVSLSAPFAGLLLFAITLVSTARFQAPLHTRLRDGFDRDAYTFLLATNWIRTAAWSFHAMLALWMVWRVS
ncbi:hypothetical protein BH20CHL2_BH20CHL2_07950 [soil metagenome]